MEALEKQLEEKLEESQGTARDVAITTGLHTRAFLEVRDEFIVIGVKMNIRKDP